MTLAVAARFPWPELLDSLPEPVKAILQMFPRHQPSPAILMTADSRWSYFNGSNLTRVDNGGVKIGLIHEHAIGAFAGDVAAGQRALGGLRAAFVDNSVETVDPQEIFRSVWRNHGRRDGQLSVCLGLIDAVNTARLFRYDLSDDFAGKEIAGIEALGAPEAITEFTSRLSDEVKRWTSEPASLAVALHPEHWSTIIATTVWRICHQAVQRTVGGPIQSAILTTMGAEGRALWLVDPGDDEPQARRVSLTPEEVEEFYERQREHGWRGRSAIRT